MAIDTGKKYTNEHPKFSMFEKYKADKDSLKGSLVEFEFMGDTKSKKINIFQYKNKTGNRRKMGYREDKKIIKITSISNSEFGEEE